MCARFSRAELGPHGEGGPGAGAGPLRPARTRRGAETALPPGEGVLAGTVTAQQTGNTSESGENAALLTGPWRLPSSRSMLPRESRTSGFWSGNRTKRCQSWSRSSSSPYLTAQLPSD